MLEKTAPVESAPGQNRSAVTWLLRRWPALVAVALVAPDLISGGGGGDADVFGQILPMLALIYLLMAKLDKRRATWAVVLAVAAVVGTVLVLDLIPASTVLIGASLVVLLWTAADGELRTSDTVRLQALGVVFFCGLVLVGLTIEPKAGILVIAAGWFLHGVWDFVHLWKDRVVSRSFAEWCGVFDVLIAAQLVLLYWR